MVVGLGKSSLFSWLFRSFNTRDKELTEVMKPTAYATPRTIRPYSLGQNPEWDAVSRMLAAGLVTVCPDPMAVGLVRVEMVDTAGDIRPQTARVSHPASPLEARPQTTVLTHSRKEPRR
jgi:hypothetical protein